MSCRHFFLVLTAYLATLGMLASRAFLYALLVGSSNLQRDFRLSSLDFGQIWAVTSVGAGLRVFFKMQLHNRVFSSTSKVVNIIIPFSSSLFLWVGSRGVVTTYLGRRQQVGSVVHLVGRGVRRPQKEPLLFIEENYRKRFIFH